VTVNVCDRVLSSELQLELRERNGSGERRRIGTRITEEYRRSACEYLKCDWKMLYVIFVVI
jgi:hypothetical protein